MGIAPAATDAAPFADTERADIPEHRIRDLVTGGMVLLCRSAFSAQLVAQTWGGGGASWSSTAATYVSVEPDGRTITIKSGKSPEWLPAPKRAPR